MTNLSVPTAPPDRAEAILEVFHTAPHPLTAPQAEKLYRGEKLKKNEFRQIVESQLLMQGKLFKCSPSGKNPRYWAQDEEEQVREKVQELLSAADMAESKLATAVNKALPKVSSAPAIKDYLQTMRREGLVHEQAGKGRAQTKLLSLRPSNPFDVVSFTKATLTNLSKALAEVEALGGTLDSLLQIIGQQLRTSSASTAHPLKQRKSEAEHESHHDGQRTDSFTPENKTEPQTPQVEIDDLILKGMRDLDSAAEHGASVLLRDLRRHMPAEYRRHEIFDTAVIRLAEQERIVLHRHDQPSCLTDAERDELVRDEAGTFYISLAKRV